MRAHEFSEAEYTADAVRVARYALEHGRAYVVRADGTIRVAILIPPAEIPMSTMAYAVGDDAAVREPPAFTGSVDELFELVSATDDGIGYDDGQG